MRDSALISQTYSVVCIDRIVCGAYCQERESTAMRVSLSLWLKRYWKSWSLRQGPCTQRLYRVVRGSHIRVLQGPREYRTLIREPSHSLNPGILESGIAVPVVSGYARV